MSEPLISAGAADDAAALLKSGFRVVFWLDEDGLRRCYAVSGRATVVAELGIERHVIVEART